MALGNIRSRSKKLGASEINDNFHDGYVHHYFDFFTFSIF